MFDITITAFAVIILILYYITTKNFGYWKKKNVPYPTPLPLFGNYLQYILLQKSSGEVNQKLCQKFRNEPYFGTYFGTEPALVILDPELIKLVFAKDFYYFSSRELMDYRYKETITQNLFFQSGDTWKAIRGTMTSSFSTLKLRNMFALIQKCNYTFEDMLDRETKESNLIGAKALMIRYTMDCICSCGFGIEAGTMGKEAETNPFTIMGGLIIARSYLRGIFTVTRQMWPDIFYGLGLRSFPKEIDEFFHNLLTGVFKSRDYTPTKRSDFVDNMLMSRQKKVISIESLRRDGTRVDLEVDDSFMVSQCVAFFGAGFETSASALSLTLYELAKNQPAQKRAQEEIDAYLKENNNTLSDDCVSKLPFLEACVMETLRLYPVLTILTREAVEGYTFPTGLHVEKGTRIHLPVFHIHRDPELFPDPEEYRPERFMPGAEHPIKPYSFFPFGEGPRTCLGMRLSKLQVFPGLITFLKTYSVSPASDDQLRLEATTILLQPVGDIPVLVSRRPGWETRVYTK